MTFIEFVQFFGDFTYFGVFLFSVSLNTLSISLIVITSLIGIIQSQKIENIPGTDYSGVVGYKWFGIPCIIFLLAGIVVIGVLVFPWSTKYASHFRSCNTSAVPTAAGHVTINMGTLSTDKDKRLIASYLATNPVNVTICQERETLEDTPSEPFVYAITLDKNNSVIRPRN